MAPTEGSCRRGLSWGMEALVRRSGAWLRAHGEAVRGMGFRMGFHLFTPFDFGCWTTERMDRAGHGKELGWNSSILHSFEG